MSRPASKTWRRSTSLNCECRASKLESTMKQKAMLYFSQFQSLSFNSLREVFVCNATFLTRILNHDSFDNLACVQIAYLSIGIVSSCCRKTFRLRLWSDSVYPYAYLCVLRIAMKRKVAPFVIYLFITFRLNEGYQLCRESQQAYDEE